MGLLSRMLRRTLHGANDRGMLSRLRSLREHNQARRSVATAEDMAPWNRAVAAAEYSPRGRNPIESNWAAAPSANDKMSNEQIAWLTALQKQMDEEMLAAMSPADRARFHWAMALSDDPDFRPMV